VGEMSCNPSIGGVAKGTLVREIDALDGLMGRVIDRSGIQFRVLNRSAGPAVQGPRAQADRDLYKAEMHAALAAVPNLTIVEDTAEDVVVDGAQHAAEARRVADADLAAGRVSLAFTSGGSGQRDSWSTDGSRTPRIAGVTTGKGAYIATGRVVVTTGTFLRGMVHVGRERYPAGRHKRDSSDVEAPSVGLALTLERLLFPIRRLTTGTPPRLDGRTIDYEGLGRQYSDDPPVPLSLTNDKVALADKLVCCYVTHTNAATHAVINAHRHLLPSFEGNSGKGQGPRYCPAIEKKVRMLRHCCGGEGQLAHAVPTPALRSRTLAHRISTCPPTPRR